MPGSPSAHLLPGAMLLLLARGISVAGEPSAATPNLQGQIFSGQGVRRDEERQLAEAEGTVTFFGKEGRAAYLEITSDAGHLPVTVTRGTGFLSDLLLKSRVRIRGVQVAAHGADKMVYDLAATNAND